MMDAFVKAYQAAELNDRVVRVEQMTDDEELYCCASSGTDPAKTPRRDS
jgi:hypothetical protein